jgi:ATP-dependent Clp protease ATP-binding subunit ClpB
MNFQNYTTKAQEVIQEAIQLALEAGQQGIETGHLAKAVLATDTINYWLKKSNPNAQLGADIDKIVESYPKVSNQNGNLQPFLSNDLSAVLPKLRA